MKNKYTDLYTNIEILEIPDNSWIRNIYPKYLFRDEYYKKFKLKSNKYITSIFNIDIPEKFIKSFYDVQVNINKKNFKFIKNMLNFIKLFIDTTDKLNLCNHFRQQQIEIAKNHCFNNNIQIRKIYKDNNYIKLLENVDRKFFIKKYFPIKQNVNYNNIKLSLESMYSVSHWRDNDEIIKYLNKINFNIKDSILIDPTANVGGISIYFAFHFKNVYSIEN